MRRPIGAHAPVAGGLAKAALPYADATKSHVLQIYLGNPRSWAPGVADPGQDQLFRDGCTARRIATYVHACLLTNLASPTEATVTSSVRSLRHALHRCAEVGGVAVVFHAGSAVSKAHATAALAQLRHHLTPLLDLAGELRLRLLVEPSAGGGRGLVARVEQLGDYFDAVDHHPALGVCFDTCHAWAAGHDVAAPGGMTATVDTLIRTVGSGRLGLIHANDSKDACGSRRDRHESIGAGNLGKAAFGELLGHPATAGVPVIVETPSTGAAGHARDVALLRRLQRMWLGSRSPQPA